VNEARAGGSRVRTVFLGSGGFAIEPLRRLSEHPDADMVGVVTSPARSTPVRAALDTLGIEPVLTPRRLRAPESIAEVISLRPELLVLADYGQIVPAELLSLPHGALNLHPSVLPRHRGATPIATAILDGDPETGVSLMRMDAGLDTGPIVAQRRVTLRGDEIAPDLEDALSVVAGDLLASSLGAWLRGELPATPQAADGVTLTRPLRREDGRLDPTRSAAELERQVRAYQPWPGSFIETGDGRLVIWSSGVEPGSDDPPGRITPSGLATSDGFLAFDDVQPAGGRRMPWQAYLRGHPRIVGSEIL
jgi:methionyl-tRNA formyltransferase